MATYLEEIEVKFGEKISLRNVLPPGKTDCACLSWDVNGKNVELQNNSSDKFEIKEANFMDSGIYKCKYGEEETKAYKVTVYDHLFGDKVLGVRVTLTSSGSEEKPDLLNVKRTEEDGRTVTDDSVYDYSDKPDDSDEDSYKMKANPIGIAVILNIMEFANLQDLEGMKTQDTEHCIKAFQKLQFEIRECKVAKKDNIISYLNDVAAEDHSKYDCFVLFVGSHGGNGFIACSDYQKKPERGIISNAELLNIFLNVKSLRDKPKLLFFDSCRQINVSRLADQSPIKSFRNKDDVKEHYRHVLIGYAAIIGTPAWGNKKGGFYTQHLTSCLTEYAQGYPLSGIMEKVNQRMKEQTAICESTLEKSLYFLDRKE